MLVPALYALICLIWGSTWLVIKLGMDGVPPFLAAGLRFCLASAVLFALVWLRRTRLSLSRDDKIAVASCGLLSFMISYACVYWSEQYISSGLAAVLYCTMPLGVALLSRFWTKSETLSPRKVAGIATAMAGTLVLFWPGAGVSRAQALGMAVALFSVGAAAVNLVIVKRHSKHSDIFLLNACGMGIGATGLLTLSALSESWSTLSWNRTNVLAIVYLALIGSVAAFLSYYRLIKELDATTLSLVTLIFPVVAVVLGWLVRHETMSAGTFLGMLVVFAGVAVSLLPAKGRRAKPANLL